MGSAAVTHFIGNGGCLNVIRRRKIPEADGIVSSLGKSERPVATICFRFFSFPGPNFGMGLAQAKTIGSLAIALIHSGLMTSGPDWTVKLLRRHLSWLRQCRPYVLRVCNSCQFSFLRIFLPVQQHDLYGEYLYIYNETFCRIAADKKIRLKYKRWHRHQYDNADIFQFLTNAAQGVN